MPRFTRTMALGAFVVAGLLLFAFALFLIGERRKLFSHTFIVWAEFLNVSSLPEGAMVRVGGMDAGDVEWIAVPASPTAKFRVSLKVEERFHPLIRTDSVATIQTEGMLGNKFVLLLPGTEGSPPAPDQSTIRSKEPIEFANILQQASDTIKNANDAITSVQAELKQTLGTADTLLTDVSGDVKEMTANGARAVDDVQTLVAQVKGGQGTLGALLTDRSLYDRTLAITQQAQAAADDIRKATTEARQMMQDIRSKEGAEVGGIAADLKETLKHARLATGSMAENMEALKHNFFLRGFFKRRGYFDLNSLSVADYRVGKVLLSKDRRVVRVWVTEPDLFEQDGVTLSQAGREHVDEAMDKVVQYPEDRVLVVEGYSSREPGAAVNVGRSRARAASVRDYILGRFRPDENRLGSIGLGSQDVNGRPADGVALAVYASKSAIDKMKPARETAVAPASPR